MDYEKNKEALEIVRQMVADGQVTQDIAKKYFPEIESEDERIRKELLEHCKNQAKPYILTGNECPQIQSWIAWLEKKCPEPNWCHHKVDLSNCSEEYCKAYYDGWNNCNMQHSQCKSESNDVVKCLINGMKFYYEDNTEATWGTEKFSMKVKDIIAWLEKQGEQKPVDKIEPKIKIEKGKWYVCNAARYTDFIVGKVYYCPKNGMLKPNENEMARYVASDCFRFWTIQDAKDGDVLSYRDGQWIFIYKDFGKEENEIAYYALLSDEGLTLNNYNYSVIESAFSPVTKEQREQLEKAIADAGYTFDFEKKELKKIEQNDILEDTTIDGNEDGLIAETIKYKNDQNLAWSEEDESILQGIWDEILANKHHAKEYEWKTYDKFLNWLKSLRPQNRWKPTEKHMRHLWLAAHGDTRANVNYLIDLYNDLKKLRDE